MIHFKSHNLSTGFTFIEVVLAITMVGSVLTAVFMLQNSVLTNVALFSERLTRIFLMRDMMDTVALERAKQVKELTRRRTIGFPATTITYERKKINAESVLKNFADDVFIEQVRSVWQEGAIKRDEAMITFLFKPEKEKPEKK